MVRAEDVANLGSSMAAVSRRVIKAHVMDTSLLIGVRELKNMGSVKTVTLLWDHEQGSSKIIWLTVD